MASAIYHDSPSCSIRIKSGLSFFAVNKGVEQDYIPNGISFFVHSICFLSESTLPRPPACACDSFKAMHFLQASF